MKLPPKKRPGNPILASDWNTLVDALAARTPRPSAGMEIVFTSGGFIYRMRPSASGSTPAPCPFGELVTWTEGESTKTGIRGGVVYCGDKNYNVENHELDLAAPGTWLIQIPIECESNRDDDHEVILPGIKTSAAETVGMSSKTYTTGTNYDSNTNPGVETGLGTIIIPLGRLVIADGAARFENVSCGDITVGQCGGTLTHTRA